MTDPVSINSRAHVQPTTTIDTSAKGDADKVADDKTKAPVAASDEVVLSQGVEKALAESSFDEAKVASIKAAIESGNYPLDHKRIAESFLAIENMISGK